MSKQYQFEFNEWAQAFAMFYRKKAKDSAFCLVISTAPYASGYWIERDAKADSLTAVYRDVRLVKNLQRRVRRAVEKQPRPMSLALIGARE